VEFKKKSLIMVSLIGTLFLFACGGGGGSGSSSGGGGTGTVAFSLTDNTTDKYRAVYVTIKELQICSNNTELPNNDCKWSSLDPPDGMQFPKTYNLLKLVNGVTEAIGSGEFSSGEYHQVRLIIGREPELENNLLGEPHPEANYVILNDGMDTIKPLKVPSGPETGIKLIHQFTVGAGKIKDLVLDFDACRSVIKAGNSGMYILKPTVKVIEPEDKVYVYGNVTVSDSTSALGGVFVSAQISDGLSSAVVRSTITDDGDVDDNNLAEGDYLLDLLSPGQTYNIVAYTAGKSPECFAFNYNDGYPVLPLNFILSNPTYGSVTVSGEVSVQGDYGDDFPLVITVYTELNCGHPDGEGYVELTQDANISFSSGVFNYSIQIPISDTEVSYYIVASAEGYVPDTGTAIISDANTNGTVTVSSLILSPGQ
jgi:hypothetical protein